MDYKFIANKVSELTNEHTEHQIVPKGKRHLNAIIIGNGEIRPTFYAERFECSTEEEIVDAIVAEYKNLPQVTNIPDFSDFEKMKGKIVPCLVAENGFVDNNIVVEHFIADIDMYYRVCFEDSIINGNSSVIVTKGLLNTWGCSTKDLHDLAIMNLSNMNIVFNGIFGSDYMFVLTNQKDYYGANVLLDMAKLEEVRCKIGDFYIIPSSVHEVICLPICEENKNSIRELENMVHEVNSTVLAENELLSQCVYIYTDNGLNVANRSECISA